MTCALRAEYEASYAEAQDKAARIIWQSIKRGPDGAPDWDAHEWTRPGGWVFLRGDESVSFNPMEWERNHDRS